MRVRVDEEKCIGCGLCYDICPNVFKMNDEDIAQVIVDDVPAREDVSAQEAADLCPAEAIEVVD